MNKSTIIMVIIILGLVYYYYQEEKKLSDNFDNLLPQAEKPILSHKQHRQLKKKNKK